MDQLDRDRAQHPVVLGPARRRGTDDGQGRAHTLAATGQMMERRLAQLGIEPVHGL
jgi:hypothetical protein